MTYREMLQALSSLSSDQLDMDASIFLTVEEEYFPVSSFSVVKANETDVLDEDHPFFTIEA